MKNTISKEDHVDGANPALHGNPKNPKKGLFIALSVLVAFFISYGVTTAFQTQMKEETQEQMQAAKAKKTEAPKTTPILYKAEEKPPEPAPEMIVNEMPPENTEMAATEQSQPPPIEFTQAPPPPPSGEMPPTPHEIRLRSALMVSKERQQEQGESLSASLNSRSGKQTSLMEMLVGSENRTHHAETFKNRNMLLAKGTVITCNMVTRLETEIAGQTACVIPNDIYSENGNVLLLERGTVVEGEYQNVAAVGRTRIFVLWTRARTPYGVTINLDSAAADRLGGAGMDGEVDNHWFKRFGSALMFSLIQDGIATGLKRLEKSKSAQTLVYENSEESVDEIVKEILKSTANIPPTIYRNQGDKVGLYISRDLDFSSVYKLTPKKYD